MCGLKSVELESIVLAIQNFENVSKAVVFGSRAKGTQKYNSDIDIALFGNVDELSAKQIATDLEELPMPYKFDVIAFSKIANKELMEHINRVGIVIYET